MVKNFCLLHNFLFISIFSSIKAFFPIYSHNTPKCFNVMFTDMKIQKKIKIRAIHFWTVTLFNMMHKNITEYFTQSSSR